MSVVKLGYGEKSVAILTIFKPGKMTDEGRREIAAWMRRQARNFAHYGEQYSEIRFVARYLIKNEEELKYGRAQKLASRGLHNAKRRKDRKSKSKQGVRGEGATGAG